MINQKHALAGGEASIAEPPEVRGSASRRARALRAPWTDAQRAHFVLRLTLGLNLAAHGIDRVGHAGTFADALVRDFQATPLPSWSVRAFGLVIPFAELLLGIAVLLGLRLRAALTAGGLLIAALMFGMCLREAWEIVGVQLVYALAYFVLGFRAGDARLTVDGWGGSVAGAGGGEIS